MGTSWNFKKSYFLKHNNLRDRVLDRVKKFKNFFCYFIEKSAAGASEQFWKFSNYAQEAFPVDSVFSIVIGGPLDSSDC